MSKHLEAIVAADRASDVVFNATCSAIDNAGQTLIDQGRRDARFLPNTGTFTDEMLALIVDNLICIMSAEDCPQEVRDFFAPYGIAA